MKYNLMWVGIASAPRLEWFDGSADDSTEPFGLSSGRKLAEVSPEASPEARAANVLCRLEAHTTA